MSLRLTETLPTLIKNKYATAVAANALAFAPSQLAILHIDGIAYQLRYCPSLAKKPTPWQPAPNNEPPKSKPDPFADPSPSLLVSHIPTSHPTHFLVLNKFPIIRNHFILATIANEPQHESLEPDDLALTYACLRAWESSGGKLFAFFNCGEQSGASQAHRHIQFLPVEDMQDGDVNDEWSLLMDAVEGEKTKTGVSAMPVPFQCLRLPIVTKDDPDTLYDIYKRLCEHADVGNGQELSYNLAMTTENMVLCVREREGKVMRREDGSEAGYVALNGTILGGTLMVKTAELFDLLKNDVSRLREILRDVGIPSDGGVAAPIL